MEIDITKLILPSGEKFKGLRNDFEMSLEKFFENLPLPQLKMLHQTQANPAIKDYFEEKILKHRLSELQNDDESFTKLRNLILGSHLDMTEYAPESMKMCAKAVQTFLAEQPFEKLADMYERVYKDLEDDYPSFAPDAFDELLIAKVTKEAPLASIEKACYYDNDYGYEKVSKKIQKKLDLVFN